MKFFKFITQYRFSYIDLIWLLLSSHLFREGMFLQGISVFLGGLIFTIFLETIIKEISQDKQATVEALARENEWKRYADSNQLVEAIKRHRSLYGTTLKEARDEVFKYLGKPI